MTSLRRRATPMWLSGESQAASVGVRMISAPSASSTTCFSWLIFSGIVMMTRYPRTAAASAMPMPVLPEVGSMSVKLREDGTDEALLGLCKRWSITSNNQVEDQQEKAWVVDVLTAKGAVALKPLGRYMKSAPQLSYALAVMGAVADKAQVLELVDPILADETPGYTRDPERRLDLIRWLGEWKDGGADAAKRLVPYLKDFDQNVRVAAADAIADADPALTADALLAAFLRPEEESGRFRKHRRLAAHRPGGRLRDCGRRPPGTIAVDAPGLTRGSARGSPTARRRENRRGAYVCTRAPEAQRQRRRRAPQPLHPPERQRRRALRSRFTSRPRGSA
jgi:hypothetical protein